MVKRDLSTADRWPLMKMSYPADRWPLMKMSYPADSWPLMKIGVARWPLMKMSYPASIDGSPLMKIDVATADRWPLM